MGHALVAGLTLDIHPVRRMADNTKKGISLQPACAAAHYADTETELAQLVLPAIQRWLGAPVLNVGLHRWKFSEPITTYAEPCVWRAELGLGFAGDAFGGSHVENAAISGLALAQRIGETAGA